MNNLALKIKHTPIVQETGVVLRVNGPRVLVETESGTYEAVRAVSCLVAPQAGDLVLTSGVHRGMIYILAVLSREDGAGATIAVDGDLTIQLKGGRFAVAAQEGVSLASGKDVSVVTGELAVNAVDTNVASERLSFLGRFVQAEVEKVKLFAVALDTTLERFSQRVKRSFRTVAEIDQVRAHQIDYAAKKNASVRGQNTLVTAEELVKVDGEQVHLG